MIVLALLLLLTSSTLPAPSAVSSETSAAEKTPASRSRPSEDEPDPPKLQEAIVVTATRSARDLNELPVSATVIGEKDLAAAPALSVDDVLRTIPGVQMPLTEASATIASQQKLSIHGLGGTRALVLLDGIPLHDPYNRTVQWMRVPIDTLRQVEVVRGANASLFGSGSLGGTVNLLTRPVDGNGIRLDVSTGSADTNRQSLALDRRLGETLGLRLEGSRFDTDGYIRVPDPGAVDSPGWSVANLAGARLELDPSPSTSAFLRAQVAGIDWSEGTQIGRSFRDALEVSAGVRKIFGDSSLLSVTAYRQEQEELRIQSSVAAGRVSETKSAEYTVPLDVVGGSIEWSTRLSERFPLLAAGADVSRLEATEDRTAYSRTGAVSQQSALTGGQEFAAVFAQLSWAPTARLEILASARYDRYDSVDGSESIAGGATTVYPDVTTRQFDPRVSFRLATGGQSAIRGSVYRAFRAPTLRDLYQTSQTGTTMILANPYLEPETLAGAEAGFEWSGPAARFEVNLFRSSVDGLLARVQVPGQPPNVIRQENLGRSRSQGVALVADVRLNERWSLNAGYTWSDASIVEDPNPALVGKILPEVVPHIGSVSLRYRDAGGRTFDVRARALSDSYGEPTNAVAAPAHQVLDLSAAVPLREGVRLYAILENAFDEEYFAVYSVTAFRSAPPRSLSVGLRAQLGGRR